MHEQQPIRSFTGGLLGQDVYWLGAVKASVNPGLDQTFRPPPGDARMIKLRMKHVGQNSHSGNYATYSAL